MQREISLQMIQLRYAVGFLGEKNQFAWWTSSFLNANTKKMLEFTFPKTAVLAQYQAASAAAAKVHDKAIGIGQSFHLFRLPEFIEKMLIGVLNTLDNSEIQTIYETKESALRVLEELSGKSSLVGEGPINIGKVTGSQWELSVTSLASAYLNAFNEDKKAFPYFQGDM